MPYVRNVRFKRVPALEKILHLKLKYQYLHEAQFFNKIKLKNGNTEQWQKLKKPNKGTKESGYSGARHSARMMYI